jgi:hypothetical protein
VYVAAGAPDSRQSFDEWWKPYPPAAGASEIKPYGDGYVALTPAGVSNHFLQDIPADDAEIVFATQGPLAGRCFGDKIQRGGMAVERELVHRRHKRADHSARRRARFRKPNGRRNARFGELTCADAVAARSGRRRHRQRGCLALRLTQAHHGDVPPSQATCQRNT